ncbi:uncharacterized protein LOC135934428 isoform X1 [Cloeon dipterum]|uniref:uncharacterized protein LOC135934428 isoform X1 n=1 Tax=Cloeon dipterum TaxID=197152 RepID=UPI00322046E8
MVSNRFLLLLCLAVILSYASAWQEYDRGRRESKPWKGNVEKNINSKNRVPLREKQRNAYNNDEENYRRYHHAGDWSNQHTPAPQSGGNYCDQYAHDPYKHAKCVAQRAPRQPANDPRCQRYVYEEPQKLALCEQRAQGSATQFPHCQHHEYDPYKLAKCERKAQQAQGAFHGQTLKAPQCSRYLNDLYKLSQCEDRAQGGATQVPQCQQFSYDPYKLSKCERKAEFWNEFKFDPALTTSTNPACQQYAYDPYKMQKCDYKLAKMMAGQVDYS